MKEQTQKRIIIAGSRDFSDYGMLERTILADLGDEITSLSTNGHILIVSGGAKGADRLGERFAEKYGLPVRRFLPDWNTYGKSAGPIRNTQMAKFASEEGAEGVLYAFWDGQSSGTKSMIELGERYGLDVNVVPYNTNIGIKDGLER